MKSKTIPTSKNTSDPSELERVKLDLLSLVSHELRTPLTSVLNAVRMLGESGVSAKDRQVLLEMAQRNAEKLNATLNQLLDLSKLVSGRLVCRLHEVSLEHVLRSQAQKFLEAAKMQGFRVEIQPGQDVFAQLPMILGDAPRLEQVMSALFENALKFSSSKTEKIILKIQPKVVKGKNAFTVIELSNSADDSGGAAKVFEVFAQKEHVLNRTHEGIGGSLAIAREIVEQHSGWLEIKFEKGRFVASLALPLLESEEALLKVLASRVYALKTELGATSLMVLEAPLKILPTVYKSLKEALFRASDAVYSLYEAKQIAVVIDDCKKSDARKIVQRLVKSVGADAAKSAKVGLASFPEDGTEPEKLLASARKNLTPIK